MRAKAFAPALDADARLLILGSLPGAASLAAGQYYAHPRNAFWRLMGAVLGMDLAGLPYDRRLDALRTQGVGLWDVIASADRRGSLDTAIRAPIPADLVGLLAGLPRLRAIGFNGGTAARLGRARLAGHSTGLTLIDLPSSSPAYTLPYDAKRQRWIALASCLAAG